MQSFIHPIINIWLITFMAMRDFKISFFPKIGDSKFRVPTETGKPGMKIVMEHEKLAKSQGILWSVMEFYQFCPLISPNLCLFFRQGSKIQASSCPRRPKNKWRQPKIEAWLSSWLPDLLWTNWPQNFHPNKSSKLSFLPTKTAVWELVPHTYTKVTKWGQPK